VDNDKFQEAVLKHLAEIDKFQEAALKHLAEIDNFQEASLKHLAEIGSKLKDHDGRFTAIEQRLERIKEQGNRHHEELEKVATQVEKLVLNEDEITDFLIKRRKRM